MELLLEAEEDNRNRSRESDTNKWIGWGLALLLAALFFTGWNSRDGRI